MPYKQKQSIEKPIADIDDKSDDNKNKNSQLSSDKAIKAPKSQGSSKDGFKGDKSQDSALSRPSSKPAQSQVVKKEDSLKIVEPPQAQPKPVVAKESAKNIKSNDSVAEDEIYDSFASAEKEHAKDSQLIPESIPQITDSNKRESDAKEIGYSIPSGSPDLGHYNPTEQIQSKETDKKPLQNDMDDYIEDDFEFE